MPFGYHARVNVSTGTDMLRRAASPREALMAATGAREPRNVVLERSIGCSRLGRE